MAYSDLVADGPVEVADSPSESRRFGLSVGRLLVGGRSSAPVEDAVDALAASSHDVVVMRYPSRLVGWAARLQEAGFDVLPADTLLYFRLAAEDALDDAGYPVRVAVSPEDRRTAEGVVRESFEGYGNHYAANPRFDQAAALEGYVEWALSTTLPGGSSDLLLHVDEDGTAMGATTALRGEYPEIPLVAIKAGMAGKGVYRRVLPGVEQHLFSTGASEVFMSTQSHNIAVLRTWSRRRWMMVGSFATVHVTRR